MPDPWKRREVIGDCTLYLGDCLEVMPVLGKVDAVVTERRDLEAAEGYPWRGIMSPSLLRLIEHLEKAGHYDASKLTRPTSLTKTISPYKNSPYDYQTARRVEAGKAERKWARAGGSDA